jgi:putative transposase
MQSLSQLKTLQQNISRKKKGSNNRYKARTQIAKLHEHIAQQRDDFLHKTTAKLVNNCKFIATEDLNIKSMQQSAYNSRNINDSSWGKFLAMLGFKAESAGCRVVKVDPIDTTKECSECGHKQEMPLYKRGYDCPYCKMSKDRDTNSAIIILRRALECDSAKNDTFRSMKQEAPTLTSQC